MQKINDVVNKFALKIQLDNVVKFFFYQCVIIIYGLIAFMAIDRPVIDYSVRGIFTHVLDTVTFVFPLSLVFLLCYSVMCLCAYVLMCLCAYVLVYIKIIKRVNVTALLCITSYLSMASLSTIFMTNFANHFHMKKTFEEVLIMSLLNSGLIVISTSLLIFNWGKIRSGMKWILVKVKLNKTS